jgi:hypothetical protein
MNLDFSENLDQKHFFPLDVSGATAAFGGGFGGVWRGQVRPDRSYTPHGQSIE